MKKFSILLAILVLSNLGSYALAQDDEAEEKDLLEVAFFGGLAVPGGGLSDWSVPDGPELGAKVGPLFGGDIGVFATANLVIGVSFAYTAYPLDTDENVGSLKHRFYNPSIYLKYFFFSESNLAPFIKIHGGIDNPKFTTEVFDEALQARKFRELTYDAVPGFGGGAGLFYYTSDYSGLFVAADFQYGLTKDNEGTFQNSLYVFQENYTQFNIVAGINVFFGSD